MLIVNNDGSIGKKYKNNLIADWIRKAISGRNSIHEYILFYILQFKDIGPIKTSLYEDSLLPLHAIVNYGIFFNNLLNYLFIYL